MNDRAPGQPATVSATESIQLIAGSMIRKPIHANPNGASKAAKTGSAFTSAYTASKHGVIGLTRSAALELAEHSITVNAVCPNHITTLSGRLAERFHVKGAKSECGRIPCRNARTNSSRAHGAGRGRRRGLRIPVFGRSKLHHR